MAVTLEILVEAVQEKSAKFLDIAHPSVPACLVIPINEGLSESAKLLWQMAAPLVLTMQTGGLLLSSAFCRLWTSLWMLAPALLAVAALSTGQRSIKVYTEQCHKAKTSTRHYSISNKTNLLWNHLILVMTQCCFNQTCLLWKIALLPVKYQSFAWT